jgi:hypothetical protein
LNGPYHKAHFLIFFEFCFIIKEKGGRKMARKVTPEDIVQFNELYYKLKTYAAVARETGFSASTVSKYVDKNWRPVDKENIIRFKEEDLPEFSTEIFKGVENYGDLCVLSFEEIREINQLWEELSI